MTRSKHSKVPAHEVAAIDFPVVAIGASAGGLDPIVAFLTHVPPDSGIAYVVIQHLDPTQKAMLPELLQRATSIPVTEITQRAALQPNHIYVIPSNADLGLSKGALCAQRAVATARTPSAHQCFLRTPGGR